MMTAIDGAAIDDNQRGHCTPLPAVHDCSGGGDGGGEFPLFDKIDNSRCDPQILKQAPSQTHCSSVH